AEHDARTRRDLGRIDHLRVRQRGFELLDAALDETLLLAGGVVFGVLAQVAMRARLGDGVDHRRALDRLQFFKLRTQALRAAHSQGNPIHACKVLCSSCNECTGPAPSWSSAATRAQAPATVVE